MIQKTGNIVLETNAEQKSIIKTNISFDDTDRGTAVLRFSLTRNNFPLLVNPDNTKTFIFLVANDGYYEKVQLAFDDSLNGKVSVTLSDEFLKHSGQAKGQIYISVDEGNGVQSTITKAKFLFNIERSLINDIPTDIQITELRVFADLEQEIRESHEEIKDLISDASSIAEDMRAILENGINDLTNRKNEIISEMEQSTQSYKQSINDLKNSSMTELDSKASQIKADVETLNKYDTTNWQKSKITDDNGFTRMISAPDLSVTTLDNYFTKTEKVYVTTPKNSPHGTGVSGFINVTFRTSGYGILTFQPYSSNNIYMTRRVNNTTWADWVQLNPDINKRKWLGTLGSTGAPSSVLELPGGFYECSIPAEANLVNAPFDTNRGGYIAEIDVFEGANGRKQIELRHSYSNLLYVTTIHTNKDFRGWKKVVTEDYGKQQNADTGWIQWQLENGAINRNETTGEGTLYRNEYRVITTNGVTRAHIRFNISNITPNAIVGRIPARMVPKAQTGLLRTGLSRNPVVYTINIDGSIKLMVHSNDISSWDTASYCIGEHSWIVDAEFFDNIETGSGSELPGESADDLAPDEIVENPDEIDIDPGDGDPTNDEEISDVDIIDDGEEDLPDYGDILDELDEDTEESDY
ncbi:BppU family phage baseplate upper protein [Mammaliicoccus sciuri]|uniref:BppU family phage baseplate upper protein n=1 Tax=Mammaliicoccus sciuri TaxID=1296 RepID=UPI00162886E0|nr:BppU family phage baseplate upper protein [Mammaliicoccus sciuri]